MSTKIVTTENGKDFSSIRKILLCDANGYALDNSGAPTSIRVVDTNGGKDFSNLNKIILTDTNGQSIS